jgi:hypothetical protein
MKMITLTLTTAILLALSAPVCHADTLLIDRVKSEQGQPLPKRGDSMAQVEAKYGAAQSKSGPVGGGSPSTPPITRWTYGGFSVYFENSHVVDAVLNKASAEEIGPAPAR